MVPLFALLLGVFSFVSQRDHLEMLVAQPIPRSWVLLGKYLGLLLTVFGATLIGFGLPGVVISLVVGAQGALQYAAVVLLSLVLVTVFIGLSVLIAILTDRQQIALGVSVAVWLSSNSKAEMLLLPLIAARLSRVVTMFCLLENQSTAITAAQATTRAILLVSTMTNKSLDLIDSAPNIALTPPGRRG